jgi:hypothetical protein
VSVCCLVPGVTQILQAGPGCGDWGTPGEHCSIMMCVVAPHCSAAQGLQQTACSGGIAGSAEIVGVRCILDVIVLPCTRRSPGQLHLFWLFWLTPGAVHHPGAWGVGGSVLVFTISWALAARGRRGGVSSWRLRGAGVMAGACASLVSVCRLVPGVCQENCMHFAVTWLTPGRSAAH